MNGSVPRDATRAIVSLGAFRKNLSCVRSYCGTGVRIMPVVKANAYGHGLIRIAREAVGAGADALAVARVSEALEVREAGIAAPLLVFEIPPAASIGSALAEGIDLTVSTQASAGEISALGSRAGKTCRVHIKVDTGMTRLGFPAATAVEQIASVLRLPRLELAGLYSHFATSDEPDTTFAAVQIARFREVLERLRRMGIEPPLVHMANSGAIMRLPDARFDMVRPGIMLYGYAPSRTLAERYPVEPVMGLVS
ncbi:MAG TPA: alanine racemase, partial [Bacteroidota bacterium]|nr:alanine racemase [Bacteroidota bacterium]